MKKTFLLIALFCLSTLCFSQNKYDDGLYKNSAVFNPNADNYTPHLVDRANRFELGIGVAANDYEGAGLGLHGGYYLSHRVNASADLFLTDYYQSVIADLSYTYEAIPSLRGGFYFNIGVSAGLGVEGLFQKDYKIELHPFLGPSLSVRHHIFEHFALASHVAGNLLSLVNDDWSIVTGNVMLIYQF